MPPKGKTRKVSIQCWLKKGSYSYHTHKYRGDQLSQLSDIPVKEVYFQPTIPLYLALCYCDGDRGSVTAFPLLFTKYRTLEKSSMGNYKSRPTQTCTGNSMVSVCGCLSTLLSFDFYIRTCSFSRHGLKKIVHELLLPCLSNRLLWVFKKTFF